MHNVYFTECRPFKSIDSIFGYTSKSTEINWFNHMWKTNLLSNKYRQFLPLDYLHPHERIHAYACQDEISTSRNCEYIEIWKETKKKERTETLPFVCSSCCCHTQKKDVPAQLLSLFCLYTPTHSHANRQIHALVLWSVHLYARFNIRWQKWCELIHKWNVSATCIYGFTHDIIVPIKLFTKLML